MMGYPQQLVPPNMGYGGYSQQGMATIVPLVKNALLRTNSLESNLPVLFD